MSQIVIPTGMPGPDGVTRTHPIHLDSYDLIYGPDNVIVGGVEKPAPPIETVDGVAEHYNRSAQENGKPHRVRVEGGRLVWLDKQLAVS